MAEFKAQLTADYFELDTEPQDPVLVLQHEMAKHEMFLEKSLDNLKQGRITVNDHHEHCRITIPKIYSYQCAIQKLK
jgi:hypothetical protein